MKIIYLILLILIVYIAYAYIRFRSILSKADNLPQIEQVDQTMGTGPKLKYVAAGDSTAVGGGASEVAKTYPYQIAQDLSQKYSVQYKNLGVSGATTADLIAVQLDNIIRFNPDIITISIGANDTTHLVSTAKIIENYKVIINELTQKTKAKVYITDVPRFDKSYLFT